MLISSLDIEKLTENQMCRMLFDGMEDDGESGECIFVAGSSKATKYRLPKAVELYRKGRASKILFSGGVQWEGDDFPEALMLRNEAVKQGIPEEDILTEDVSLHTKENVLASLLVLDRTFHLHNLNRLLIVTSPYHMQRLYLTMKTYMPNWVNFSRCPVSDHWTCENTQYRGNKSKKRVKDECEKIIHYVKLGALSDADVNMG